MAFAECVIDCGYSIIPSFQTIAGLNGVCDNLYGGLWLQYYFSLSDNTRPLRSVQQFV